jgi:hypothetical protein
MGRLSTAALLVTLAACDLGRSYDSSPPAFDIFSSPPPTEQAILDEAGLMYLRQRVAMMLVKVE